MLSKLSRLHMLLKHKGLKWTYNYIYFQNFYMTKNPIILKYLQYVEPYPTYIEIETTTKCNLKCVMCEHTYWNEPSINMTFEQFKNIVDQFPKLKWIGLTGIGESFLNPEFMSMLRYVKEKNIYVELFDTFYFIDETIGNELIEMRVDKLIVSLDAATSETYNQIRVGSDFDKVITNLKRFIKMKNESNSYFPEMEFHFIISKINQHEIEKYLRLIKQLGVHEVFFSQLLHDYLEVSSFYVGVSQSRIDDVNRFAKSMNIKVHWNLNTPQQKPFVNRCTTWSMPFIFVTGHVIPCCSSNEANQRNFQKETSLGNVFETSFKNIWNGDSYVQLRSNLRNGIVPNQCKNCCLFDTSYWK